MSKIYNWIDASPHKPWCQVAAGNIYSSGGPCDCGKQENLDSLSKPKAYVLLDKAENTALAVSTTLSSDELLVAYLKNNEFWDQPFLSGTNSEPPMTGKEAFESGALEKDCVVIEVPVVEAGDSSA